MRKPEHFVTRMQIDNCENCNPEGKSVDRNCASCGGWGSKFTPVKVRTPEKTAKV